MQGKTVVITGANSGIGREAARALLGMGAEVVLVCRNRHKAEDARADILQTSGADPTRCHIVLCDLSSQAEIRRAADELLHRLPKIDVLVNNAGLVQTERQETVDGLEATLAVNHLAPMLLTNLLLERLRQSAPARVITVSSGAHIAGRVDFADLQSRRCYLQFRTYANTKLMNVLFTRELARRLHGTGVVAHCVHPGFVDSGFGPQKGILRLLQPLSRPFMINAAKGADSIVWLASAPEVADRSGHYIYKRRVARTSRAARDPELARRLWDTSAALVGLTAPS